VTRIPTFGRRALLIGSGAAAVSVAHLGLGAWLSGCSDSGTGGRRVLYESHARADVRAGEAFVSGVGWEIEVSRAQLCVEHLVYLEGAPVARAPRLRQRLRELVVPEAHAHPGHYDEGQVFGEMVTPGLVDLLAGDTLLGSAEGVTGVVQSAMLRFADPAALNADEMEGAVVVVEGIARLPGDAASERSFVARALPAEVLSSNTDQPEVYGCPVTDGDVQSDGVMTLEVHVRLWLDQVDFAELPAGSERATVLPSDGAAFNAFHRGLRKVAAYTFTFEAR
jgi:hypothetical protein